MKSFNVTEDCAKFVIDKEKRTIVCIIEKTEYMFIDFAQANFKISPDCDAPYLYCSSKLYSKLRMPNRFIGVAHCDINDNWDEEIGRVIAFSRAKDNLLKSFFKRTVIYENFIADAANEASKILDTLWEKLDANSDHRHRYIEELINANTNV